MQELPYSQIIDLKASLAFANPAARQPRPRRRRECNFVNFPSLIIHPNLHRRHVDRGRGHLAELPGPAQRDFLRTPYRPPPNTPFSHIQIIPKASPEGSVNDEHSPQVTFRSPSYSKEAEEKMAAPFVPPNATASLANMTSGTTFAAKARAAELNAVRSRRAAKELEMEEDVPSATPLTLGALKFTKARNRGRGWKAINLDDLPEGSEIDPEDFHYAQASRPGTPQYSNDGNYSGSFARSSTLYPQAFSSNLTQTRADYNSQEWIPDMQPANTVDRGTLSRRPSSHLDMQPSRPSSVLSHRFVPEEVLSASTDQTIALHNEVESHPLEIPSELKQTNLGTRKASGNDDPFTELPQKLRQSLNESNPYGQQSTYHSSSASTIRPQQPAVKGTMDYDFRFPLAYQQQQQQQPAYAQQYHNKLQQGQANYLSSGTKSQHVQSVNPHQRDPMPYTGFAASSKKELLLQTFNDAVESSKAEGSLPTSTRTVLYDPVAREHSNPAQSLAGLRQKSQTYPPTAGPSTAPSECNKEVLMASDPLPWKDRLVDVYKMTSPVDTERSFARPGGWPTSQLLPPGLCPESLDDAPIWSLVPKPKPAGRSFEEAEKWFRQDTRGLNGIETYLENAAASQGLAKSAIAQSDTNTVSERCVSEASKWSGTSASTLVQEQGRNTEIANQLMGPVLGNLQSYINESTKPEVDYFGRFSRVPEWCIDNGQGSNTSFFGDWGVPPSRVGRDPRYRPTFHEGRYTVFEPVVRRGVREGLVGGFR